MGLFSFGRKKDVKLGEESKIVHKDLVEAKQEMDVLLLELNKLESLKQPLSQMQFDKSLMNQIAVLMNQIKSYEYKIKHIISHLVSELSKENKTVKKIKDQDPILKKLNQEIVVERKDLFQYQHRLRSFNQDINYARKSYSDFKRDLIAHIQGDSQVSTDRLYKKFTEFENSLQLARKLLIFLSQVFKKILSEESQIESDVKKRNLAA